MSFRPLLRPGLRLHPRADGGVGVQAGVRVGIRVGIRVEDPPAGLSLELGPTAAALLPLLDGHLDVAQALAVAGDPDEGARALRSLAMTGCLLGVDEDGRRRRVEARAAGAAHAEVAPFQLASGTRFECGACGACCRTVDFGPLTRDEMDRLAGADFVQADPALRAGPLFVRAEDPADPLARAHWTLARRPDDGACVFLDEASRCRVALELGPAARPLGCQLFPWAVQPTSEGVVVADGLECATFSTSAAAGAPVYEDFDGLRPLLREAARRAAWPARDGVRLASGVVVTAGHARLAVTRAVEVMDGTPGDWQTAAAAALGALAVHEAILLEEPIGPGLPGRVIDRLWATPLEALAAGPDGMPTGDEVAGALGRLLARLSERPGAPAASRGDGERACDDLADAALRRALRQRLHGLALEAEGALAPVVAAALVDTLITAARAAELAAADGRARASAQDVDRAQPEVTRAARAPARREALRAGEADAVTLVLGGAALALVGRHGGGE